MQSTSPQPCCSQGSACAARIALQVPLHVFLLLLRVRLRAVAQHGVHMQVQVAQCLCQQRQVCRDSHHLRRRRDTAAVSSHLLRQLAFELVHQQRSADSSSSSSCRTPCVRIGAGQLRQPLRPARGGSFAARGGAQPQLAAGTKCLRHEVQRVVHVLQERRVALQERLGQLECRRRTPGQQLALHQAHPALQRLAERTRLVFVEVLHGAAAPAFQGIAQMLSQPLGPLGELQPCQPPPPHGLVLTGELQQHASQRWRVLLADEGLRVLGKRRQHRLDGPLRPWRSQGAGSPASAGGSE